MSNIILLFALAEEVCEYSSYIKSVFPAVNNAAMMSIVGRVHDSAKMTISVLDDLKNSNEDNLVKAHQFIFNVLPATSTELRSALNKSDGKLYTPIFQKLGDNLRQSGRVIAQEIVPEALLKTPF